MALDSELIGFVKDGLRRGVPRAEIHAVLVRAGWPPDQVGQALRGFAEIPFPLPVPRPAPSVKPREAFLYAVLFATLFMSAFNLGAVVFGLLDLAFPYAEDPDVARTRDEIRFAVSVFVVAAPVCVGVARVIQRSVLADPAARASRLRQQLTYLTLFIASCILIGCVAAVVYNFLGGALAIRFVLKVATVAALAGSTFAFFLRDLRRAEAAPAT